MRESACKSMKNGTFAMRAASGGCAVSAQIVAANIELAQMPR
jgi:hypothetical protein